MSSQDDLIQQFCSLTGASPQQAAHYLEASNSDLGIAVDQFFSGDGDALVDDDDDDAMEDVPAPPPQPSKQARSSQPSSSGKQPQRGGSSSTGPRIATLGGMRSKTPESESDHEDDIQKDFFAGGEKSGLAVRNPGKKGDEKDIIQNILKQSSQRHHPEDPAPHGGEPSMPRFTGSGHTLGSDDTPSVAVPSSSSAPPARPTKVTRSLTFWRDGFSVEDGPLMRYDDPANREILQAIQSGRAPIQLMNVEQGQEAEVNVFKRLDEDYVPPKKKRVPFSGRGNRLGSPAPEIPTSSATSSVPVARPVTQAAPVPPAALSVAVDGAQPTTTLQIRLGDGTRLTSRFNQTHTVADLYSFVNAASTASRIRTYVLQTTFPNKELRDHTQTLKEAGLINAVVVQKWC